MQYSSSNLSPLGIRDTPPHTTVCPHPTRRPDFQCLCSVMLDLDSFGSKLTLLHIKHTWYSFRLIVVILYCCYWHHWQPTAIRCAVSGSHAHRLPPIVAVMQEWRDAAEQRQHDSKSRHMLHMLAYNRSVNFDTYTCIKQHQLAWIKTIPTHKHALHTKNMKSC